MIMGIVQPIQGFAQGSGNLEEDREQIKWLHPWQCHHQQEANVHLLNKTYNWMKT